MTVPVPIRTSPAAVKLRHASSSVARYAPICVDCPGNPCASLTCSSQHGGHVFLGGDC